MSDEPESEPVVAEVEPVAPVAPKPARQPGIARYALPLLLLSFAVFAPLLWLAFHTVAPADPSGIKTAAKIAWTSLAYVAVAQAFLVGAAAKMAGSQLRALRSGALQLLKALGPCLAALLAVLVGTVALVIPGLLLIGLFAFTAASDQPGIAGPLLDSAAIARRNELRTALVLIAIAVVDAGLVYAAVRFGFAPATGKPDLHTVPRTLRVLALAFAVLSPIAAGALAQIAITDRRRAASPARPAAPADSPSHPLAASH